MTMQAIMPGPHGPITAYKRTVRQVRAGDWLPDYGAHALTDAVEDPDGGVWLTLEDGRDERVTVRKVWVHRRYQLAGWQRDAVTAYRAARDARNALRESGTLVPAGVIAGTSGGEVACYQLTDAEFAIAYPAPRLAEYLREYADANRTPEEVSR